mgnify:CR=1 FL=1
MLFNEFIEANNLQEKATLTRVAFSFPKFL